MDDRDRGEAKKAYAALYAEVRAILNRHDPVWLIGLGMPEDEYEPEVNTILPRLKETSDALGVQKVLHEEFVHWFGGVAMFTYDQFEPVAADVWAAWSRFQQK